MLYKITMKYNKNIKMPATYGETVYQFIKQAILNGKLKTNERIKEKEIAVKLNVSITPVREAIRRLFGEKLFIINARKEIIVAGVSWKEIQEIYEVIGILDFHGVCSALDQLTSKNLNVFRKMTKKLDNLLSMEKAGLYFEQTLKIHDRIWSFCNNKFLYKTLSQLIEKIKFFSRQGFSLYPELPSLKRSYEDHQNLILAIEKHDVETLRSLTTQHWHYPY